MMFALAIEGGWMKVRFVQPPEYPLLGCGDNPEDFEWTEGWIRWQDNGRWLITEEHHYGC